MTRGGGRDRKLEVSSRRIIICRPVPGENEMMEGEWARSTDGVGDDYAKSEFKNLTSAHKLELSTFDIMIILKKSV